MTLRELINTASYKKAFNYLYKTYYKDKKLSKDQIIEIDLSYSRFCEFLISTSESIQDNFKIYITQPQAAAKVVDVCILDEPHDEIMTIDHFKSDALIDMEIYEALKLESYECLAHILYAINKQ